MARLQWSKEVSRSQATADSSRAVAAALVVGATTTLKLSDRFNGNVTINGGTVASGGGGGGGRGATKSEAKAMSRRQTGQEPQIGQNPRNNPNPAERPIVWVRG
ncbi:hypothetical protein LX32DRAFT_652106 [Colletotrichum zoysiae]|uniref:Uncharacterized protein n=1 Tax=Colletotrichum zoysiae TaxID=1216348 RepID=A0AAD9HIV3_9PEZI|nr:hypothetical protein LX32DRAFT_652106 [Colletotrichum zoysiae]